MSKRTRRSADGPKGSNSQDISALFAKAKAKQDNAEASGVKPVTEAERPGDGGHVIPQFYENTFTAFTEVLKGGDLEDIAEDQRKLLDAVSSLALQEQGRLPSKQLFTCILQCISENRSADLSLDAYALMKKLQQKFPATRVVAGEHQGLPYVEADSQVWTPLDASTRGSILRGTAAAAFAVPPPRAGSRPRTGEDGNPARQGDFFAVLSQVTADVSGESEVFPTEAGPSARGRKGKKAGDAPEMDEAAKQQARLEAEEALAVQKLGSSLMFKYLVGVLYDDLSCRLAVYRAHNCGPEFGVLMESLLYRLVFSDWARPQRDQVWKSIFTIIKATAPERAEQEPELSRTSQSETMSQTGDGMDVDPKPEASGTPTKGRKRKKGKAKRASVASVSQPAEAAPPVDEIEVESPLEAALEKRRTDLAAKFGLACSKQDLCTTAQTLLASMLELTATMENLNNKWQANDLRKSLLNRMVDEFGPTYTHLDMQRHFLETMLSPQQKLRFILDYFHHICPRGSESWKVLDQKGAKAKVGDLLAAVRENVKKLLSQRQSTPDELALLVSHAVQVSLLIGTADAEGLKQDLDLTLGTLREALPAAERKGRHLSAAANAAMVAASITTRLAVVKATA